MDVPAEFVAALAVFVGGMLLAAKLGLRLPTLASRKDDEAISERLARYAAQMEEEG